MGGRGMEIWFPIKGDEGGRRREQMFFAEKTSRKF